MPVKIEKFKKRGSSQVVVRSSCSLVFVHPLEDIVMFVTKGFQFFEGIKPAVEILSFFFVCLDDTK
jgi:hypothetical protein